MKSTANPKPKPRKKSAATRVDMTIEQPFYMRNVFQDTVVFTLVMIALFPVMEVLMGHQGSRMAFTGALVDGHTIGIDAYKHILGVDFAVADGRTLSDKAPGQAFLVAPFYWLGQTLFGIPDIKGDPQHVIYFGNKSLWWLTLWTAKIPAGLLAVLMRRTGLWLTGSVLAGFVTAITMLFGTLLLPFGSVLFAHDLAALLGFACWFVIKESSERQLQPWEMALSGALGGLAVLTEYTTAIVVLAVGVLLLITQRLKTYWYVLGGLPFVGVLAWYNTVAWGKPWSFSYSNSGSYSHFHQVGLFGIRPPNPVLLAQVLFGERGIFLMTPICLIGFIGLWMLLGNKQIRWQAAVSIVIFTCFAFVQGGWWSVTAGASPGPRYVVAGLPFLALGVAYFWQWSRIGVILLAVIGLVPMLLATWTFPLAQPTEPWATAFWFTHAMEGKFTETLARNTIGNGWMLILMLLALIAGTIFTIWLTLTKESKDTLLNER